MIKNSYLKEKVKYLKFIHPEILTAENIDYGFSLPDVNKGVHILEKISIGGLDQSILVRGKSDKNPVLLILHGGPGCSAMGLVSHYNADLENNFLVVNWDQRGTCKSFYPSEKIKDSMNVGQFVRDTHEMINYLKNRFNQDKIFLLGYSWGSIIGTMVAEKYPEMLHAYIGISQVVNLKDSEKIAVDFIIENAKRYGNKKAIKEIESVSKIKPSDGDLFLKRVEVDRKWVQEFGGAMFNERGIDKLKNIVICSLYYSLKDLVNYKRGWELSVKHLWKDMLKINFLKQKNNIKIPVYFIHGKHDFQTPLKLVEKYFKNLEAQRKELIVFENSAHHPIFEEPERFNQILTGKVLQETYILQHSNT